MRKPVLALASLAVLAACGSGGGSASERVRERFDATVAYVRGSFERENGALESAFLAEGAGPGGRAGQFVCGVGREGNGEWRAFMSPAIEGDGTRELMTTAVENRDQREWYTSACRTPVRDASGQEIRFEASAAAAPAAQSPATATEPAPSQAPGGDSGGDKDPAAGSEEVIAEPVDEPAGDKDPAQ